MKLNSSKTRGIVFSRETNIFSYTHKLWDPSNTCTDTITDLGVNAIQNCISTHMWTTFLLISKDARLNTNYNLFILYTYSLLLLSYLKLAGPKPEYASTVWKFITSTDAEKLECIQRKFVACANILSLIMTTLREFFGFLEIYDRRLYLDVLLLFLFIQV